MPNFSNVLSEEMPAFKKIKNTAVTFAESDAGKFVVASLASGVKSGTSVDAYRKLYPIPSADISSNTNLKQNTGY